MEQKQRCRWCNLKNLLYIEYHDNEWCVPNFTQKYLYEMLILESFQAVGIIYSHEEGCYMYKKG